MANLFTSLARAVAQLGDPRILKVLAKTIGITLVVFVGLGFAANAALQAGFERMGMFAGFEWTLLLTVVITLIGGWLLFRLVALAVLQFFADEVVQAVEAKHYPAALSEARNVPFREELRHSMRGLLRAVVVNLIALPFAAILLVTGIGTAIVFWAANSWLLGRELQDMVWLRHSGPNGSANGSSNNSQTGEAPPLSAAARFALGGVVAAIMILPVANLLAPVIGAATATHMVHRKRDRARNPDQAN